MLLLVVVLGYYGVLFYGEDTMIGKIIETSGLTMALSFFAFFAALAGLMKIFIDAIVPRGYNKRPR